MKLNEISAADIERLDSNSLPELLNYLLNLEWREHKFPDFKNYVSTKTTVGDGGEDGRVECSDTINSRWITNKLILFQSKAMKMGVADYKSEVLVKDKTTKKNVLKPRIKDVLSAGGKYLVFTNHNLSTLALMEDRVKAMRASIKEVEHGDLSETADIEIYDAVKIQDWVNNYLPAQNFVRYKLGQSSPNGLMIWKEFSSYFKENYITNDILKKFQEEIRVHVTTKNTVLRIIGLSGLGKSRLVLEAFRSDSASPSTEAESNSVLYCKIGNNSDEYINYLKTINHYSGIVILDDCDLKSHKQIEDEAKRSGCNLRFITIDYDLTTTRESEHILLKSEMFTDVVFEMLKKDFGSHFREDEIKQISKHTEGYPQLAVAFAEVISKRSLDNVSGFLEPDFLAKLIFGREPKNEQDYQIIQCFSIFRAVQLPLDSDLVIYNEEHQKKLLKHTEFICTQILKTVSKNDLYRVASKFEKQGLIERRGNMIMVKPKPLALRLAMDWWNDQHFTSEIKEIFENISNEASILEELSERLKELDGVPRIQEIFEQLLGPSSPFGTAEVLNSRWGSRFFRAVIEVNPLAMTETLWRVFGSMSQEELIDIQVGRRDLIWSLEKLCFRKETFSKAAKVLCNFAVGENENLGNNATQQFLQLFHIHLPNTEVDFVERFEIIKWCLQRGYDYKKLAISALERCLKSRDFHKMGGAEQQGSALPLVDYQPKSQNEIWAYWEKASVELFKIALSDSDNELSAQVQNIIAKNIDTILLCTPDFDKFKDTIIQINQLRTSRWDELYKSLRWVMKYQKGRYGEKYDKLFKELSDIVAPTDIRERIKSFVSSPSYEYFEADEMERISEVIKEKAENIAIELADNLPLLLDNLDILYQGSQQEGYIFGEKLAKELRNSSDFIECSIKTLEQIDIREQNISVLLGYFDGSIDKDFLVPHYKFLFNHNQLSQHCFNFIKVINPDDALIYQLFELIDSGQCLITRFNDFIWGHFLEKNFDSHRLIQLCKKISQYSNGGEWAAIALYSRYMDSKFMEVIDWRGCKEAIKDLVMNHNFTVDVAYHHTLANLNWRMIVISLLDENVDSNFVEIVSKQVIEYYTIFSFDRPRGVEDDDVLKILELLLTKHFRITWALLGESILQDFSIFWNLKMKIGFMRDIEIFSEETFDVLFDWCVANQPIAANRLIQLIPYSIIVENKNIWHPLTMRLINDFGNDTQILNELSARIHSFSSIDSRVPYYEVRRDLTNQLTEHSVLAVRKWAQNEVDGLERSIKAEKIGDAERTI